EFQSIFHLSSRKFKIQAIPNVFALRKSYELSFVKKHDGYKLCAQSRAKSSFDWFFLLHLKNSKYWLYQRISAREVVRARFRQKIRWSKTLHKVAQS
ncbi:hypothetical protein B296_00053440, partial [Ensete ventricosum]